MKLQKLYLFKLGKPISLLLGLAAIFPMYANGSELPAELIAELKPRCDKMMQDIRDNKMDDMIKEFHPMLQTWNEGKLAKKMAMLSINGYQREDIGQVPLDKMVFLPQKSSFRKPSKENIGQYPDMIQMVELNYSFDFVKPNGRELTGGVSCILFEAAGKWYFEDNLPF